MFIGPNGNGTFVWPGLYSVDVDRNGLFNVFDVKWLVNMVFFQFRKFCKKMCQKWYVLLACDAKATPQILNCDRKMLLVSVLQLEFSSKFLQIEKTDWANIDSKWLDSHRGTYQKPKERFLLFISSFKKDVAPVFFDRHGIKTNFLTKDDQSHDRFSKDFSVKIF